MANKISLKGPGFAWVPEEMAPLQERLDLDRIPWAIKIGGWIGAAELAVPASQPGTPYLD